jgi:hypothetical protein
MIERYREVVTTTEPSPGCPARVFFRSTEMIMSVADIPIDFFGGDVRADIVRDVLLPHCPAGHWASSQWR